MTSSVLSLLSELSADLAQQVFDDYVGVIQESSPLLTRLPTPVFWYGLVVGQEFSLCVANGAAAALLRPEGKASMDKGADDDVYPRDVTIKLERVGPKKKGSMRTVSFKVGGATQDVEVKDSASGEDFKGPLAAADDPLQVSL